MEPIRILYVNGGIMSRGGIESFMMNYYRHMDKEKIQIDFIVHGFEKGIYDDEIIQMGGRIHNVPIKSKDYLGNVKALNEIFNKRKYNIIHSHMDAMGMIVLKQAKKCGIPIRIAHSHNTQHLTKNHIKFMLNEYARKNITRYATHLFACSEPAARWLFGDTYVDNKQIKYVKNAIDLDKYKFNIKKRIRIREDLNLGNSFIVGHVGRFDYQKNHLFLLDTFTKFLKIKPDSKLVLVGDGHLKCMIKQKISELNIKDKVILTGTREDIYHIMNAFDVFCLPSNFEGLGIVLIEAQVNGLKCITSNHVPKEANITGEIKYLDLEGDYEDWVTSLFDISQEKQNRVVDVDKFISAGYSISSEAHKLQNIYISFLKS